MLFVSRKASTAPATWGAERAEQNAPDALRSGWSGPPLAGHRLPNARRPSGTHSDTERDPTTVHGDVDRSDPGHRPCGDHRRGLDGARAQRVSAADDG